MSDIDAQQAREHQRSAAEARRLYEHHLQLRDQALRRLYQSGGWSYNRLARVVGITPELVAKIIRPQVR